jgi:ubiquinone/menaquinone biosynthesis C-methylase UbiE
MLLEKLHTDTISPRRIQVLAHHIASLTPPHLKILDIGSGDGNIAFEIQKLRPDLSLSGIDVLLRPQSKISVTPFDGTTIPYSNASFDLSLLVDVLHHTTDPLLLLKEAVRVSKKWVIIKDHHRNGFLAQTTLTCMDWIGNARFGVALPYHYLSQKEWENLYPQAGLRLVERITNLKLYPPIVDLLFGRKLHSIVLLEKV